MTFPAELYSDHYAGPLYHSRHFNRLISTIRQIRETRTVDNPVLVRQYFMHNLQGVKQAVIERGCPGDVAEQIVYALVGTIDETMLMVTGPIADFWLGETIQLEMYGANNAGDLFFDNLERQINFPHPDFDFLYTCYACLGVGFEGRYLGSQDSIHQKMVSIAQILVQYRRENLPPIKTLQKKFTKVSNHFIPADWMIIAATVALATLGWFSASSSATGFAKKQITRIVIQN